jgi:hypothetical protein
MPKTSLGTSVYGPDPSFAEGIGNIAEMFNPKAQAQGALMQAHRDYYGNAAQNASAQARLHAAEAAGIEDQNSAYADSVLADAGYTPMQRAAIRAARSKSVADIFKGVNENTGATILQDPNGNWRAGMALLGEGTAATNPNSAFTKEEADAVALRNSQNRIAELQNTPRNVGDKQTAYILKDGKAVPFISGGVDLAPGHTYYNNNGGVLTQSAQSPIAHTGSGADPLRAAETSLALQDKLNTAIIQSTATLDSTGRSYANQPNPEQVNSISAYAVKLIQGGMSPQDALNQSALQHGVKLNQQSLIPETTPGRLWGENNTGRYLLKGFRSPNGIADTVAPQGQPVPVPSQSIVPTQPSSGSGTTGGGYTQVGLPANTTPSYGSPAPETPVQNSVTQTNEGGLNVNGVSYIPGHQAAAQLANGQATHAINKNTGESMVVYWNAGTNKFQSNPVFKGNEDTSDFESMRGNNNFLGILPNKRATSAARDVAEKALQLGVITEDELKAAREADAPAYKKLGYTDYEQQDFGPAVQNLLLNKQDSIIQAQRIKAGQDPRIAQYASGQLTDSPNALPSDAMELAEQLGINRAEFGIPQSGFGEGLPLGIGALFAPAGYGSAREAMQANLPAFFRAVQEGRIDPKTLAVKPSIVPQTVSSR